MAFAAATFQFHSAGGTIVTGEGIFLTGFQRFKPLLQT